ncbi:MAG: TIGR03086 family protein [Mycobacterium sp.]|nr:TIGR03086 family protein [Mycobacterium sp.]
MNSAKAMLHLAVCRRFGEAVGSGDGKWDHPSPCEAWDARGVLEHVIGFHDTLLLRPLGLEPDRPTDEPQRRWEMTFDRLCDAFTREELFEGEIAVPAVGTSPATQLDAGVLVPLLTRDVLVHTWDLARAVGADDRLDPRWCAMFFDRLPDDPDELSASGMFAAPVEIDDDTDTQAKLLARLGRDPSWQAPNF